MIPRFQYRCGETMLQEAVGRSNLPPVGLGLDDTVGESVAEYLVEVWTCSVRKADRYA